MEMTYTETLVVVHCHCGIALAIPETLNRQMRESEKKHCYCPLGHQFVFGNTYKDQLEAERAERERESAQARRREQAVRDLLTAEEQSHRATKGHLTRMKKRQSAGVCPCCNRSFQNVARHMSTKHPDYAR